MRADWTDFLKNAEQSLEGRLLGVVWSAVTEQMTTEGLLLPLPRASASHGLVDSSAWMAWEAGEHYVDIDIEHGGALAWFYKNRKTDALEGSGEPGPCAPLPEDLMGFLRLVAGAYAANPATGGADG